MQQLELKLQPKIEWLMDDLLEQERREREKDARLQHAYPFFMSPRIIHSPAPFIFYNVCA